MTARARQSERPIVYDVTRLVTRALNPTPNGVDRIDFALARHFLGGGGERHALICTALGPRLADARMALDTLAAIESYWREDADAGDDATYAALILALNEASAATAPQRLSKPPGRATVARNWRAMRDWALHLGRSPREVPEGAIYVSASQFLIDRAWYVGWLDRRADVRPVFYGHDLLAVDMPEYFRPVEARLQPRRMRNICRYGAGVVVGARAVARRLDAFARENGRADLPICVARPKLSPVFRASVSPPAELAQANYFVVCGTIEPRKNHLLLLNVWRELARRGRAPKLVVVGKRGWLNANVVDLLERSAELRPYVIEVSGLSTPGLCAILSRARALLAPSMGEGFGLPLAEALAAHVPVIASDIEVFREIGGDAPEFIDPIDGLGWLQAIQDFAAPDSRRRAAALARHGAPPPPDFLETIDGFLATL